MERSSLALPCLIRGQVYQPGRTSTAPHRSWRVLLLVLGAAMRHGGGGRWKRGWARRCEEEEGGEPGRYLGLGVPIHGLRQLCCS